MTIQPQTIAIKIMPIKKMKFVIFPTFFVLLFPLVVSLTKEYASSEEVRFRRINWIFTIGCLLGKIHGTDDFSSHFFHGDYPLVVDRGDGVAASYSNLSLKTIYNKSP